MAKKSNLKFIPHSANRSLITVFTLHLMGIIDNPGPYIEFSIEPDEYESWQMNLYSPKLEIKDGKVDIPCGPGWGVNINSKWLENAEFERSQL